jgi:hypothetical protein
MKHLIVNALSLAAIYSLLSLPAHAYIDPGTGALIIQALIGGLATALFTIKLWWRKLLNVLHIKNDETSVNEQDN